MKKLIALLLALVMVIGMVACGTQNDPANEQTDGPTSGNDPVVDPTKGGETADGPFVPYGETIEFTVGNLSTDTLADGVSTALDNPYKTYLCDTLNIEYEPFWEDKDALSAEQAIDLAISGEELPDIFGVNEKQLKELVEMGLVWDMTEIYEEYASDELKALYNDWIEVYGEDPLGRVTYDGKLWGIPNTTSGGDHALTGVWLRKDWLEELNYNPDPDGDKILTLDDLKAVAKVFVEADPDNTGNPLGINMIPWIGLGNFISPGLVNRTYGARHLNFFTDPATGEAYYGTFGTEKNPSDIKTALTWWSEMYAEGLVDPDFISTQWSDESLGAKWASGQSGIAFADEAGPTWLFGAAYAASDDAHFAFYGLADANGNVGGHGSANQTGYTIVVNKSFEHPELAVKIANVRMKVDSDNELYYELCEGIGNTGNMGPFSTNMDRANFRGLLYQYCSAYLAGTMTKDEVPFNYHSYLAVLDKYKADPNSLTITERQQYDMIVEGCATFNELTLAGKLSNEFENIILNGAELSQTFADKFSAELYPLEEEYVMKIIAGQKSVDEWDEFVELWHQYGGAQILQEMNESLNK